MSTLINDNGGARLPRYCIVAAKIQFFEEEPLPVAKTRDKFFWDRVSRERAKPWAPLVGLDPEAGQEACSRIFGPGLTMDIRRYVELTTKQTLTEEFSISVEWFSYGSLIVGLGIHGLDQLVSVLNANFDLFVGLTSSFILTEFEAHFGLAKRLINVELSDTESAKRIWDEVAAEFAARSGGHPQEAGEQTVAIQDVGGKQPGALSSIGNKLSRLDYMRILLQSSLLLPLLLALLVCYVAMNAWDHDRDRAKADADHLSAERTALLDFAKSQLSTLSQQNTELNRLLAQTGASEVLGIVHDNTALMQASIVGCCGCSSCCKGGVSTPHKTLPSPICKK